MIYQWIVPPHDHVASGSDLVVKSEHEHASDEDRGVKNVDMEQDNKYHYQISYTLWPHTFSVVFVLEVDEHILFCLPIG